LGTWLEKLKVKSWINAANWSTTLGGSVLDPEVVAAMTEVASCWVSLAELLEKAGERVAQLTGAEAAYITSGAAAGTTLAAAACMTGTDPSKILRLPCTEGMRNEIILQRAQDNFFTNCFRAAGAKIVEVGHAYPVWPQPQMIENAVNEKTAALAYVNSYHCAPRGNVSIEEVQRIARKHEIPVIVDSASLLPPVSNLTKFVDLGIDLSIFSGGKGIRGPNDTGIVLGAGRRGKELIEAVKRNTNPYESIGRGFKVSKEQIVGVVAALERFLQRDETTHYERLMATAQGLLRELADLPHVTVSIIPHDEHPMYSLVPRVKLELDTEALGMNAFDVEQSLNAGTPPILTRMVKRDPEHTVLIETYHLREGEDRLVVDRLREILSSG
jgi:L-seryl-tRNA(Ser) seleniumtransferase